MNIAVLEHANRLWEFFCSDRTHEPCDAIVVCCSYDLRVCDYACELIFRGVAQRLVLSGKTGNWTKHLWSETEARVFHRRALANGIEPEAITLEERATNFGENVAFSRDLLPRAKRVTFVTKPNSVLRVALTVPVKWPEVTAFVDSPAFAFPEDVSNMIGVFGVINEMVGDIDRIVHYPSKGFQILRNLPQHILESHSALLAEGFIHHRLPA